MWGVVDRVGWRERTGRCTTCGNAPNPKPHTLTPRPHNLRQVENLRSYAPLLIHHNLDSLFYVRTVPCARPREALRGGIPGSFLEPLGRSWSHFVVIYRQN